MNLTHRAKRRAKGFQFLGIPPKGELPDDAVVIFGQGRFPISRDPPEGGT